MSLKALFFTRLRALLREIGSLVVLLLCVAASLLAGWQSQQKQEGLLTLALVNEDAGSLGDRLMTMLEDEDALCIISTDAATARNLLMQDRAQCVAYLPSDFSARLEHREYLHLAELTVSAGSSYAATVTEPLVNAVMKLWFEQQTFYDAEVFLREQMLALTPTMRRELQAEMEHIWQEGARVQVEAVTLQDAPPQVLRHSAPTLCWYAALVPLYLILSCGWMQQPSYRELLLRIRRSGCPLILLFLTQGAASLVMAAAGFFLTALLGGTAELLPYLLPHALLYGLGSLGMTLTICSLCRNYPTLLLAASTLTLAAAALSGLLTPLPDWASIWETISNILPGRTFYAAVAGAPRTPTALLQTVLWLVVGSLCACAYPQKSGQRST